MMSKKIIWILVLLIVISSTLGLGIRPAKTSIDSGVDSNYSKTFWVLNGESRHFSMEIDVEGELRDYVMLHTSELQFTPEDDSLPVRFSINLPSELPPGTSNAKVVIEEIRGNSGGGFGSRIVMKHKIVVQGPYPEKFIESKINFNDGDDHIELVSEIENKGTKSLDKIQTTFYVNNKDLEQVVKTDEISLATKENKVLKTKISKDNFDQGEYEVRAITKFEDQQIEVYKKLSVGKPEVEITYFTNFFKANSINEYTMDLLNKWNQKIDNVYVEVDVKRNDEIVDSFRTRSVGIGSLLSETIEDYFDASTIDVGGYSFDMVVHFWNIYKMDSKSFEVQLVSDPTKGIDSVILEENSTDVLTGAVVEESQSETESYILYVIIVLLLGIIFSYVLYRYIHREEYDGGDDLF